MTLDEKIKICSTCKNKTFTVQDGILCGKTSNKPEFVNACYDYDADTDEIERQKIKREELAKSDDISGFMAFYVYWSIPLGIIMTVLGLFTIPRTMEYYSNSICLILYEILFFAFYFYFSIYTVYAFIKKKPDALFIGKYQLIILFINNIFVLLTGGAGESMLDNPARLVISMAWCVIFFLYLVMSEDVKWRIPKNDRRLTNHNRILFILSIILPVLLYLGAILEITKKTSGVTVFSSDEAKVEQICKNTTAELPLMVSEGLYWTDVTFDGQTLEYKYEYIEAACKDFQSFGSNTIYELLSKYQTELVKSQFVDLINANTDPLITIVVDNGSYDIRYKYCSSEGEPFYYVNISRDDIAQISKDDAYVTSVDSFVSLVESYNEILPIEYFEECLLSNCSVSEDGSTLHYDLQLVNMTMGALSGINQRYLKEYMLELIPYCTDAPGVVARMNNMNISFGFSADCSDWWSSKVLIEPDEYNNIKMQE